jgi:uncharacterized membrane protein
VRAAPLVHPVHPALVHFPIAFWLGASACDLIAMRTGEALWWTLSQHAIAAGLIMGTLALGAGVLELWLRPLPRAALRWVAAHATFMSVALLCFMVSLSLRAATPPPGAALALSFLGSAIVLAGGFCGGTLVYRFGVGVSQGREP